MHVQPAVLNAQQSAACALTRPRATAHLLDSFARCARRFVTGAKKSVVHTTWITASAAPRLASSAPQHAARWPLDPAAGKGCRGQVCAACSPSLQASVRHQPLPPKGRLVVLSRSGYDPGSRHFRSLRIVCVGCRTDDARASQNNGLIAFIEPIGSKGSLMVEAMSNERVA